MENLNYPELKMQNYLCNKKVYPDMAKKIFRYRTLTSNCKANFPSMFRQTKPNEDVTSDPNTGMKCPECQNEDDTQIHLLQHSNISQHSDHQEIYMKLFKNNATENLEVALLLEQTMKRREDQ